jgi:hypothetical protein
MKRICLVNGCHTPGSQWALECPLRPERLAKRQARAAAIWARRRGPLAIAGPETRAPMSDPGRIISNPENTGETTP